MNEIFLRLCSFCVVSAVVGSALWLADVVQVRPEFVSRTDRTPIRHLTLRTSPVPTEAGLAGFAMPAEAAASAVLVSLR